MKNMSFALTTAQFIDRSKTVTRRVGWKNLKPGEVLQGVKKSQGLRRGEHVESLGTIQVAAVRFEPLSRIIEDLDYGRAEVILEGFPEMDPEEFVAFFLRSHKINLYDDVTRIQYVYL